MVLGQRNYPLQHLHQIQLLKGPRIFSAFELMFGRRCDPAKLIKLTNKSYVNPEELDEKLSDEEAPREVNDTFDGPLDSVNDAMRELQNGLRIKSMHE